MYKHSFNKCKPLRFSHFTRRSYALFSCLGKEVIVCTLSVATLAYAKADGISVQTHKVSDGLPLDTTTVVLDEVSVTASKAPQAPGQQARMVTVLDRKAIAAAPVQSVNDLLKYAVGVDVRQRGMAGMQTDVSIRGGNYEQVTILLNGINICDPQTGHNAFDFPVALGDIERIEVLEGPAGRVYGTSSLVGAINIVTKMPNESSLNAQVEGGSYGYAMGSVRANYAKNNWNNSLSASYSRSDGFSRCKAGSLNADYHTAKAFYQGSYDDSEISVKWHAGLSTKDFGSNTFYGASWDDQFEHTFKTFTAITAENKRGHFHLRPSLYWNRNCDRFELFRGAEDKYPFNYHRSDVYGANINAYFDWLLGRTAFGAELRNEDLISTNLGESIENPKAVHGTSRYYECGLNRTNISFVLEHNVVLQSFTFSAGLVAVKNSWNNMDMKVYPGVDVSWRLAEAFKLYASYNSSLRMPSATELYYSVGGHKADKYLKPEELSAFEGGLKYAANGLRAKMAIYYNRHRNMIDWIRRTDEGDDAVWQSVNFTKVNALGVELSTQLDMTQLLPSQKVVKTFGVSYSYIDQNKDEQEGIQSRSTIEYLRHKVVADVQLNLLKKLTMGVYYRFQDREGTYTDVNGNVQNYSPYGITDVRLTWNEQKYNVYIQANNLTNKTYVDYGNVPQPGFWFVCGAALNIDL